MIKMYNKVKNVEAALEMLQLLKKDKLKPTALIYSNLIQVCTKVNMVVRVRVC
jgi:pentatricopeptide repeat protein